MAFRLFGAKPSPELIRAYCRLDPWEQTPIKSHNAILFLYKKMKLTIASENFVWPKCKFLLISRAEPLIKTSRPEKHIRLKEFSNLRSVKWLIACLTPCSLFMMTSSNGNIFRVTGPLCEEFTRHRWISLTKASDAKLWCFLWSAPESNREAGDWRRHRAHYDVIVIQIKTCYPGQGWFVWNLGWGR